MEEKYIVEKDLPGAIAGSVLTLREYNYTPILVDEVGRPIAVADTPFMYNALNERFIARHEETEESNQ